MTARLTPTEIDDIRKRHDAHRDWMSLDPPRFMAVSQSIEAYQDVAKLLADRDATMEVGTVEEIAAEIYNALGGPSHVPYVGPPREYRAVTLDGQFDLREIAEAILSRFTLAGAWIPWSDDARKHKRVIAMWLWTNDDGQECGQDTQEIIELDKHLDFWMNYNLHQIPALPSHYALLPAPPSPKETT